MRPMFCRTNQAWIFSVLFLCFLATGARASENEAILKACAKQFGQPVDTAKNLFEIDERYAFQVAFDQQGEVRLMSVSPKYFFEEIHPEWTEPEQMRYLSATEYLNLLARLETIKSLGQLLETQSSDVVTNSTHYSLDQYEHAFLERGEYGGSGFRFFAIYFYHHVKGKVRQKHTYKYSERAKKDYYIVKIDSCQYFVSEDVFKKLEIGKVVEVSAAGPYSSIGFKDDDDDDECDL